MHLSMVKLAMNSILDPRGLEFGTWDFGFVEFGCLKGWGPRGGV